MERCVIIGGADIGHYGRLKHMIRKDDYAIYCDSGLRHRERLEIVPSLIVGDFDSYPIDRVEDSTERIVLPCEKDDTDTVYAVKEAQKRGYKEFLLLGVLGGRMDHSLGNLAILSYLRRNGCRGMIVDDWGQVELIIAGEQAEIGEEYAYFSLLAYNGTAKGVTISGAKYPLEEADITGQYQYGVSNEVLKGGCAKVSLREGELLLIKVF
ncbi:MAG: thiamine diphosphokinase [Lachnospiraceae bacterium]